jgi:ABC-type dipeptide/oligopeptide/nickel transport system permease component
VVGYVARRLLATIPVLLGLSILTFATLHLLPGDPVLVMLGDGSGPPERIAVLRRQLGLDDSLARQYVRFLGGALQGDLGRSIRSNRPVLEEIRQQAPSTLQLTLAGLGLATVLGVPLGLLAGWRPRSWLDRAGMVVSLWGVSMPSFWLGMLLIFVFALWLGWLPATGQGGPERLILPAATLGIQAMAVIALVTRAKTAEVLAEPYIAAARAKGVPPHRLLFRHALKNALVPLVTIVGLQFGGLLGGSVIVESVFARQGMGRLAVDAILNRDIPVIQGVVLVAATTYVLVNLVVDVLCGAVDPRILGE